MQAHVQATEHGDQRPRPFTRHVPAPAGVDQALQSLSQEGDASAIQHPPRISATILAEPPGLRFRSNPLLRQRSAHSGLAQGLEVVVSSSAAGPFSSVFEPGSPSGRPANPQSVAAASRGRGELGPQPASLPRFPAPRLLRQRCGHREQQMERCAPWNVQRVESRLPRRRVCSLKRPPLPWAASSATWPGLEILTNAPSAEPVFGFWRGGAGG